MPIPEHYAWPSYVKVARIISACLPDAEISENGADRIIRFEYRIEGNLILTIDSEGWSYGFNSRPGTWRSFIEGSLEKVAEYVLQPMLHQGVSVMQPPAMYDFENPPVSLSPMKQRRLSPGR